VNFVPEAELCEAQWVTLTADRLTTQCELLLPLEICTKLEFSSTVRCLTLYGNIKTAEQQTIIEQYGDWYTGWWVACYIWYSKEGLGGLRPLPISSLLYQMYQPTQQRPVYQRHNIIWCDTIIYWILS